MSNLRYLVKGLVLAVCYVATTLVAARGLQAVGADGDTSAVMGAAIGMISAMSLLWWLRKRQRRQQVPERS